MVMLPRGDDKDEDDFHLFILRFIACMHYKYRTHIQSFLYDFEVLVNSRPADSLHEHENGDCDSSSSAFTCSYLYVHRHFSWRICFFYENQTSVVVVMDMIKRNQAPAVLHSLSPEFESRTTNDNDFRCPKR